MTRLALGFLCALAAAPGFAQAPALKSAALATGSIVRLGDLVDNAGPSATTPLFKAPDLGKSGVISADRILEAAREFGLANVDARGIVTVTVRRPARAITEEDIAETVLAALRRGDGQLADATLKFDTPPPALARDALDTTELSAEVVKLDRSLERFEARLTLPGQPGEPLRLTGRIDTRLPVPVPTRDVLRGDTIHAADLKIEHRPRREIPAGALIEPTRLTGLVARRLLRAGQPVRDGDVVRPDMVERNQLVTVLFESAGMTLSLRGKALSAGAEGAIVSVLNLQSKRTIETIVIGPGRVSARHHSPE